MLDLSIKTEISGTKLYTWKWFKWYMLCYDYFYSNKNPLVAELGGTQGPRILSNGSCLPPPWLLIFWTFCKCCYQDFLKDVHKAGDSVDEKCWSRSLTGEAGWKGESEPEGTVGPGVSDHRTLITGHKRICQASESVSEAQIWGLGPPWWSIREGKGILLVPLEDARVHSWGDWATTHEGSWTPSDPRPRLWTVHSGLQPAMNLRIEWAVWAPRDHDHQEFHLPTHPWPHSRHPASGIPFPRSAKPHKLASGTPCVQADLGRHQGEFPPKDEEDDRLAGWCHIPIPRRSHQLLSPLVLRRAVSLWASADSSLQLFPPPGCWAPWGQEIPARLLKLASSWVPPLFNRGVSSVSLPQAPVTVLSFIAGIK